MDLEQTRYEPLPRWGHVSVVIGNKLYLWGGRIEDFSEESKKELASVVEVFDFETELWEKKTTSGPPPPGLYNTAYATIDHCLYVYGGWDGHLTYNNLHKLDVLTMTWTELKPTENSEVPMKMSGCGLVNYGKNKLVLFGGCGVPTEDSQQSSVPKSTSGTVSYTTVRSNEGSGVGASQEEEMRLLEVTSGHDVSVQAEVHSQPDSVPPGSMADGVIDLYNLAVSQVDSQVSHHSLSQTASSQEEATTQPPEAKSPSHTSSQMESKSEKVDGETKAESESGEKGEAPPSQAKTDDSEAQTPSLAQEKEDPPAQSQPQEKEEHQQSPKKEGDEAQAQSLEKGDEVESQPQDKEPSRTQSQSEEKGGSQTELTSKEEITAQPVPHENGEVKVQPAQPLENGAPETESQDEKKTTESPSRSQEGGESKHSSPEKAPAAATIPQSQQNGEVKAQPPPAVKEESKKPSEVEIQPQPQLQPQPQQSQPSEESEEESDDGSDVMDRRWTNELKVFDLQENTWTTPVAHGDFPPPCVDFSFTSVDNYRSVMYGGFQPEAGTSSEAYVLNMETWSWTKLAGSDGASDDVAWPVGRDGHASCLLAGPPNPQVLISGGWDKDNKLINDAWILNVNERMWKELTMPVIVGARFWHSVSCYQFSRRMKQLLFFGGCPGAPEELISGGCWAKLAATVVLELGMMDPILPVISASRLSLAGELSSPSDWVVLDATDHAQLGLPNRRLKERVLLAEYRAIRAENIAREVLKKLETIDLQLMSTPYPQLTNGNKYEESDTSIPNGKPEPKEKEEETQKEDRPFWEIPKKDVELTGVDIGKGRWSIVREATYRGDRVAARCLYSKIISEDNFKVFIECLDTAAKLRHTNLLPFIGAVLEGEPIIITELMPFNLKKVLEKKGQLLNHQIVGIALDVARALNFLHTTKPDPVVHGDLTSTSVLLEQGRGNSWRAKLSDFITAKFFKQLLTSGVEFDQSGHDRRSMSPASPSVNNPKHSTAGSSGTSGRSSRERRSRSSSIGSDSGKMTRKVSMVTPPDILDPTNLTPKRDTYSYGLLLVEMCSGSTPQVISLPFLIESITWTEMNSLIRDCIELEPESRPSMDDILPKIAEMHQSLSIGHGPSRPVIKKTFV